MNVPREARPGATGTLISPNAMRRITAQATRSDGYATFARTRYVNPLRLARPTEELADSFNQILQKERDPFFVPKSNQTVTGLLDAQVFPESIGMAVAFSVVVNTNFEKCLAELASYLPNLPELSVEVRRLVDEGMPGLDSEIDWSMAKTTGRAIAHYKLPKQLRALLVVLRARNRNFHDIDERSCLLSLTKPSVIYE